MALIHQLFDTKFNPKIKKNDRLTRLITIKNELNHYIKNVQSLTDDQVLRRFRSICQACTRSNAYIKSEEDALSFKFKCDEIFAMQTPIPYRETFVFDANLEGVHIRFGAVARGGLRWSNRLDDYRTEVLGLVKTQQTKNAVIIPVGSKGGFVIKTPQSPTFDDGIAQYKRFISAMLQLADNIESGKKKLTKNLVTYDDFDPYFVVAADKGTATFSDFANKVSMTNNFWLGDGFASGGEHGYDHKKVGITAKGAWECTKLHFKAMDKDPEKDVISVVGIGDMSGDVFGNGMLLSKSISLVAAFNHIHIFIDPTPSPAKSWKERQRLFKSPGSSWKDYKGISAGGGVFDRSAKEIKCTPEMKALFGLTEATISGEALIQAILQAEVDLLWFGGIGTYIKSSTESHIDVGDPANNSVRVNADTVKAKVIGEGANLGITQKARIDYEALGGRINTDAIDNSAGVNMSDYEVNIKILLSEFQQRKTIKSFQHRNQILEDATAEVTDLVLTNNRSQHNLISIDQYRSKSQPFLIDHTISSLIRIGRLNHIDEQIPTSKERQELYRLNQPLPRCVLAKVQAYTKMQIKDALSQSSLFKGDLFDAMYINYFPKFIQSLGSTKTFPNHRLKNDIIITELTNYFVGTFGCATFETLTFSNQIPIDQAIHNITILERIFNTRETREALLNSNIQNYSDIFKLNRNILLALLTCHLSQIELSEKQIQSHQKSQSKNEFSNIPIPLQCLLFKFKPTTFTKRIHELESTFGFISNFNQLCELSIESHVMHSQKLANLSDMISSLIDLLSMPQKQFDSFIAEPNQHLFSLTQQSDLLPSLYLYVFHLRKKIDLL